MCRNLKRISRERFLQLLTNNRHCRTCFTLFVGLSPSHASSNRVNYHCVWLIVRLYQKKKKKKSKPIKLIGDRIYVNIARIFAAIALSCSRYEGYDIALYYEASPEYLRVSLNTKFKNRNTNSSRKEKTLTDYSCVR